jgi:hypothetical protein
MIKNFAKLMVLYLETAISSFWKWLGEGGSSERAVFVISEGLFFLFFLGKEGKIRGGRDWGEHEIKSFGKDIEKRVKKGKQTEIYRKVYCGRRKERRNRNN